MVSDDLLVRYNESMNQGDYALARYCYLLLVRVGRSNGMVDPSLIYEYEARVSSFFGYRDLKNAIDAIKRLKSDFPHYSVDQMQAWESVIREPRDLYAKVEEAIAGRNYTKAEALLDELLSTEWKIGNQANLKKEINGRKRLADIDEAVTSVKKSNNWKESITQARNLILVNRDTISMSFEGARGELETLVRDLDIIDGRCRLAEISEAVRSVDENKNWEETISRARNLISADMEAIRNADVGALHELDTLIETLNMVEINKTKKLLNDLIARGECSKAIPLIHTMVTRYPREVTFSDLKKLVTSENVRDFNKSKEAALLAERSYSFSEGLMSATQALELFPTNIEAIKICERLALKISIDEQHGIIINNLMVEYQTDKENKEYRNAWKIAKRILAEWRKESTQEVVSVKELAGHKRLGEELVRNSFIRMLIAYITLEAPVLHLVRGKKYVPLFFLIMSIISILYIVIRIVINSM